MPPANGTFCWAEAADAKSKQNERRIRFLIMQWRLTHAVTVVAEFLEHL
jgi:hypothetical protein